MPQFHDFFIKPSLNEKAEELGWSREGVKAQVKIIEATDWSELKQKIDNNRENHDILAFKGGKQKLNRKAFATPKIDVVLHPEKNRKDPGMNHVDAQKAAKNNVAIGFTLKQIPADSKKQSQLLSKWRKNIKLCEKYNTKYLITTQAQKENDLRKPRDLAAITKSLNGKNNKPTSKYPENILEKNLKAREKDTGYSGVEVVE